MRALPVLDQPHDTCVRRVAIFARLSPDQQDAVGSFARPVALAAGELLHRAGEPVGQLFVVHTGSVKLVHTAPSGRTQIVRVAGPGEAVEDSRLCVFDHAVLAKLLATYPGISVGMMRTLSERLADAERRLALSALDVPARVAGYLLGLPAEGSDGTYRVRLPLAKKDIASWLATTPESFSRALARLERDGIVAVERDVVTLRDPDALDALANR